jgi:hypothetical protein
MYLYFFKFLRGQLTLKILVTFLQKFFSCLILFRAKGRYVNQLVIEMDIKQAFFTNSFSFFHQLLEQTHLLLTTAVLHVAIQLLTNLMFSYFLF